MYNRLGIYGFILLISGISSVLSGKFVYDCERKHIKTLEEKIIDLNIELLKCKHKLKTLEETNRFRDSYLQLEKCMKRIENKENRNLKLVKSDKNMENKENITDSDSFENLNQLVDENSDKSVDKSSSEDSSKSKIEPEFESEDDLKFNPLTNPSNE